MTDDRAYLDSEKAEASEIQPGWMVFVQDDSGGEWKTVDEVNDEDDFLTGIPMRRFLFTDHSTALCDVDATAPVRRPARHTTQGDPR